MDFEERIRSLSIIAVVISAVVISLVVVLKNPFEDPDLGWHLVNGWRIFNQGDFPFKDTYTWTAPGYPYADSWWLTEVLIVGLLPILGFGGLAVLFTTIGVGTLVLLIGSLRAWRKAPGTMAGLLLASALIVGPVIGTRGQTLSFFFFSLLWLELRKLFVDQDKVLAKPRSGWIYLLPFFFLFWANFHAGWVLGLALLALVVGIQWLRFLITRFTNYRGWLVQDCLFTPRAEDNLRRFSFLTIISVLVTLFNPYGFWLHRSIYQDASSALIKNNIVEWLAPNFHHTFGLSLLFFLILVVGVLVAKGTDRLHPIEAGAILFVVFNALTAVRNTTYLFSVALPLVTEAFRKVRPPKIIFGLPSFQLMFWPLLAGVVAVQFLIPHFEKYPSVVKLMKDIGLPVQSARYLRVRKPGKRVFNRYGWGGFMIWRVPEVPVFIDGRMPGWGKYRSSNGDLSSPTVFEDYIQIVDLKEGFEKTIDRRKIDWFWLAPDDKVAAWLRVNPDWKTIFENKKAVVFVLD